MLFPPRLRPALALAALALTLPAAGGLVDFPEKLIAHVADRWGREAPPRLLTWQRLMREQRM